ncbi:MAG: low affinity iron permease family protein [Dehalococcoidia bacterium]|nr:low affinity iron permease family protein [Dehalococcoidia bacterium]
MSELFRHFARVTSDALGSPWAFSSALMVVVVWAVMGPVFGFSQNWQLVINTGTTIVTFLMVFLLQNTQNRDSIAIHLKLDELLRGTKGPRTTLVHLEDLSDDELRSLQKEFQAISERHADGRHRQERMEEEREAREREAATAKAIRES